MSFLKIYLVSKDLKVLRVPTLEMLTQYKVQPLLGRWSLGMQEWAPIFTSKTFHKS